MGTEGDILAPALAVAPLAPDSVRLLWLRTTDLPDRFLERWFALLDPSEQARATRLRNRADQAAYVAAHALLRHMLSKALGGDPRVWAFETGPFGKPALATVHLRPWLHFNISHARGLVACVIAGVAVGVDVEASDGNVPSAVAERFAPGERAMLAKAAGAEYRSIFFRLWTLKEAYLKATGEGLSGRLDSPAFRIASRKAVFERPEDAGRWQIFEFAPGDSHRLALVVRRRGNTPVNVVAAATDPAGLC